VKSTLRASAPWGPRSRCLIKLLVKAIQPRAQAFSVSLAHVQEPVEHLLPKKRDGTLALSPSSGQGPPTTSMILPEDAPASAPFVQPISHSVESVAGRDELSK